MKVLIVDDEALIRRSLSRALKARGHHIVEAENGHDGLKLWKSENPDLVFLDVLMPGLTGPQVIQEVGTHRAKVILMSAFSGEHNMETAVKMGASLFVPKPFEDIFEVVKTAEDLLP
ncbi:MAG: response regulator [Bdellovibrionia bacterium]